MPIIVELLNPETQQGLPEIGQVIRAELPEVDECKVLTRIKAFVVPQGIQATLEQVFRDRKGRPIDLSEYLVPTVSITECSGQSASSSSGGPRPVGSAVLRIKDVLGNGPDPCRNPIWTIPAWSPDPASGLLQAKLPATAVEQAGIYQLSWAILDVTGIPVATNDGLMTVERSLFPIKSETLYKDLGAPTLNEIRMEIMDSSPAENFWLEEVEFGDEQIVIAIQKPIEYWNEQPPPIEVYTPRNFPFRGNWRRGIIAQLHLMAAANFRRTRLPHSAGGVTVDDRNKEKEYLAEGQRLWAEYREWVQIKKLEINLKKVSGQVLSTYSTFGRW